MIGNDEDIRRLYCDCLMSIDAIAKSVGANPKTVAKAIKRMGLSRDRHAVMSKSQRMASDGKTKFDRFLSEHTKDEIIKWYVEEDHDYSEAPSHFGITRSMFDQVCRYFGIKKDKSKTRMKGLETCRRKYGSDNAVNQVKARETLISKYGSLENYYEARKKKTEESNLAKYGFRYKATADLADNHSEAYGKCYGSYEESVRFLSAYREKPTAEKLAADLNCSINSIHLWVEKFSLGSYLTIRKSHYEQDIIEYIESLGFSVDRNDRKTLNGLELDIYVPEKRVAVEFNGNYFHSEDRLGKKYHYNKSKMCEYIGIRLIHVYQYQWDDPQKREILKSIIMNALGRNCRTEYARKCCVRELSKADVAGFSRENSLHGHRNASIYLGLFMGDELLEVMTFGKAFFSKDSTIDYECIRSITKIGTTVVGGMNKLFQYFLRKWRPNKVLYYVDYNTHNGSSMGKLGFEFVGYSKYGIINIANCKEVRERYGYAFNRKPEANKEISEYARQGKVLTIYDSGVKKYIWHKR